MGHKEEYFWLMGKIFETQTEAGWQQYNVSAV